MSRRNKKSDSKVRVLALAALGAGLILLGGGLAAVLSGVGSGEATSASAQSDSVVPARVNFDAPALTLPNASGQIESLADYRGRVVLVNNWATWCPPCKAEMPTLQAFYEAHRAEGLMVIGIEAGDAAKDVADFADAYGVTFPLWVDAETAALTAFRNGSLPNSYVIDRTGTVRLAWIGEISRAMLEAHVTPLLAE